MNGIHSTVVEVNLSAKTVRAVGHHLHSVNKLKGEEWQVPRWL